jgi:hypothetical protein
MALAAIMGWGMAAIMGVGHGSILGLGHGSIMGLGHGSIMGLGRGPSWGWGRATIMLARIIIPHEVSVQVPEAVAGLLVSMGCSVGVDYWRAGRR